MSLARLGQLKDRLAIEDDSEDVALKQIMATAASIIERESNRYFGRLVEKIETGDSNTTVTSIGHELEDGDTVRITKCDTSGMNADHEVTVVDEDSFTIDTVAGADETKTGFLRKIFVQEVTTSGVDSLFLDPRPVAAITEVKEANSTKSGNFGDALAATKYHLPVNSRGVSISGELIRIGGLWPAPAKDKYCNQRQFPSGAKVTFVVGSPSIPAMITNAMITLTGIIRDDANQERLKSESYEDYNYSLFSAKELAELPGSVQNAILRFTIPVM